MKTVWLVRHGMRLDFNEQHQYDHGWLARAEKSGYDITDMDPADAPLTKEGVVQAKHAATIIHGPVMRVYSSPFRRCRETAEEIAAAHCASVTISTDLTEQMHPDWFKAHYDHIDKIHFRDNEAHFAPGYPKFWEEELDECLKKRWQQVFKELNSRPADDFPLVIVSHGGGLGHLLNCHNPDILYGKGFQYADVYKMKL